MGCMIWPKINHNIVYRPYRVFSLTWPASMQVYWNKRKRWKEKNSTTTGHVWDTNKAVVSLFWDTNMAAETSCGNPLYSLFETLFWTGKFFTCATLLHGIVQILLQIAVLFTSQKLARFRESRVNQGVRSRALKRAGSSDLAVMQGSGYYQRDKTRWRTLYWTVREIIQRTLAIFPWHSFAASNSEGKNYFLSRSFSVLFNFLPPRTNICIENIFHLRDV